MPQIVLFGIMFGIIYLLIIRPQSKKAKETQQMLTALKKGDDVVTQGGVIGRITGLKDGEITLQVQEGVRLRVLRSAVTGLHKTSTDGAKADKAEAKAAS